jgi:hypothetical protein
MRHRVSALLAAAVVWLPLPVAADAEPDWLVAARAREGTPAPAQRVESSDKAIAFSVPAKVGRPISVVDGSYQFGLDIGGKLEVNCEIFAEDVALASFLGETSRILLTAAKDGPKGKLEASKLDRVDAGAIGSAPYMAADLAYRIRVGEEAQFGTVKQVAAVQLGHVLYCSHDEIGYVRSLREAFAAIVGSLTVAKPPAAPGYLAIDVVSISGQPLGLQLTSVDADEEGDLRLRNSVSLLLPTGGDTISSNQETTVQWTRPDGTLLNAAYSAGDADGVTSDLQLAPEAGRWTVSGTVQGKEVTEALAAAAVPDSLLASARAIRDLTRAAGSAGGDGKATTQRLWVPGVDPVRLVDVTTQIAEAVPPSGIKATQRMGPVNAELVLDRASGDLVRGSMPIGAQRMEMVRAYVQGTF